MHIHPFIRKRFYDARLGTALAATYALILSCSSPVAPDTTLAPFAEGWLKAKHKDVEWFVRDSEAPSGAGANRWSAQNVDYLGQKSWTLRRRAPSWRSSEVKIALEHQSMRIKAEVHFDRSRIDPFTVLGVFLYFDDKSEIDIEWTRWGKSEGNDLHFTLHEPEGATTTSYALPKDGKHAIVELCKSPSSVSMMVTMRGSRFKKQISLKSPLRGNHALHLNLWSRQAGKPNPLVSEEKASVKLLEVVPVDSCELNH